MKPYADQRYDMNPQEVKAICETVLATDWVGIFQAFGSVASPLVAFLLLYWQRRFDRAALEKKSNDDLELSLKAGVWHGNKLISIIEQLREKIRGESMSPFTTYEIVKVKLDIVLNELLTIPNWQTRDIQAFVRITDLRSSARLLLELVDQIIDKSIDEISLFHNDSAVVPPAKKFPPISRKDVLLLQIDTLYETCKQATQDLLTELKSDSEKI